jgi:hypothetical protein
MVWFKVDDRFHQHPKVRTAGNAAIGLWIRCGTYCSQYETDGFVPRNVADSYGTRVQIDKLIRAGLWVPVNGGWQMSDYLDYNPSHQVLDQKRKVDRERKRRADPL